MEEALEAFLEAVGGHWGSQAVARLLTSPVIEQLEKHWGRISVTKQIKTLTSFVHIRTELRLANQAVLLRILYKNEQSPNEWCRKLARLLQALVLTGRMDIADVDTEVSYGIIKAISSQGRSTRPAEQLVTNHGGPWVCSYRDWPQQYDIDRDLFRQVGEWRAKLEFPKETLAKFDNQIFSVVDHNLDSLFSDKEDQH